MIAITEAPSAALVTDTLARALHGCHPPAARTMASGAVASPAEGLALLASFVAIEDASVRQALLDAAAMLVARDPA